MKFRLALVLGLCAFNFACSSLETEPEQAPIEMKDEATEAKTDVAKEAATKEAMPEATSATSSLSTEDEIVSAIPPQNPKALSTEAVHPYKRDDLNAPKSVDVEIINVNGMPAVTDSADPNLVGGGVGTVVLMSKKEAAKTKAKGVSAEKALGWLKNGNTRFVKGSVRRDGQSAKDRKRVALAQTPHAVVLACSESVAPPEIIFDQKLGEIGVVRNYGALIDESSVHAIEETVKLGAHLIVVLDHSGCGAKVDHHDAANEITSKSKLLDALVKSGELTIKTANYNQDDGRVSF